MHNVYVLHAVTVFAKNIFCSLPHSPQLPSPRSLPFLQVRESLVIYKMRKTAVKDKLSV